MRVSEWNEWVDEHDEDWDALRYFAAEREYDDIIEEAEDVEWKCIRGEIKDTKTAWNKVVHNLAARLTRDNVWGVE
jgi:hypothetical protein